MKHPRRAVVLLDALAALALLAVLVALTLQMLSTWAIERRGTQRLGIAQLEAANLIERASALGWDEITRARLNTIGLSTDVAAILPDGEAHWTLVETAAEIPQPAAKQMRVEITWTTPSGQRSPPVRLNYWTFASPAGGAP